MSESPVPGPSRRRFLRLGLVGAGLLALGGALAWVRAGYELPSSTRRALRALTPKEFLIVAAFARRVFRSRPGDGFPTADEVGVALQVDGLVARLDEATRADLLRLLQVLEHGLPVSAGHASRFTKLTGAEQDGVLAAMATSPVTALRGAFDGLKGLCAMGYFRDPRTWRPLGYDGPLVGRPPGGWA